MERNRTVAGLDVHKDTIYLCIMGHEEAIIFEKHMGLLLRNCVRCVRIWWSMESPSAPWRVPLSTAVYWMPVWNELEGSMELKLVNPFFIRQLPGRKSDVKDAQWIAECLLKNLIKGSFVPDSLIQDMRKLNRQIFDIAEQITSTDNLLCQQARCRTAALRLPSKQLLQHRAGKKLPQGHRCHRGGGT